ncbi:MAG: TIGR01212 family radical SAM protein [bacterium]|nr:TIGR01212 family radical SAM protein [bacterium]
MSSTIPSSSETPSWRAAGLRFNAYSRQLRERFGGRVQKVSIDAGFTCPNVDGKVAIGGCVFCDNRSFSPSRRVPRTKILDQIDDGIRRMKSRYKCDKFMAYFQPATNTYAPVERLRPLYEEAAGHPSVVAMAIGTRPDCVPDDVLDLLEEVAGRLPLSVEYGMQTIHEKSLIWMNRGDTPESFVSAVERSRGRGFEICAHAIIGIPGESKDDILATAAELARLKIDSVKIHNLYAVKNTPLAAQVEAGEVELMGRSEYIDILIDFLESLPPEMVVERISGEAPPQYHVGPQWCLDKPAFKRALENELKRRDAWQGRKFVAAANAENASRL